MDRRNQRLALREQTPNRWRLPLMVALPVLVLAVWFIATTGDGGNAFILPSPLQTLRGFLQLWFEQDLATATLISTRRIAIAVGLSITLALPLGVLMGAYDPFFRLMDPLMAPLR